MRTHTHTQTHARTHNHNVISFTTSTLVTPVIKPSKREEQTPGAFYSYENCVRNMGMRNGNTVTSPSTPAAVPSLNYKYKYIYNYIPFFPKYIPFFSLQRRTDTLL